MPMKILKIIGISILGLILLLAIIGFFLPSVSNIERSMDMKAAPELVYEQVNNVKNWENWSPWKKMDPKMEITYGEILSGPGAYYTWKGPESGEGKLTITESQPFSLIKSDLDFGEMGSAKCDYLFAENADGGTKMTWKFTSEIGGNPFKRLMSALFKGMLEEQFDIGMKGINEITMNMPLPSATGVVKSVEIEDAPEINYMSIRDTASISTIGPKLGTHYGTIGKVMESQKLEMAGAPFAIYYSESNTQFDMDVAMVTAKPGKAEENVKPGKIASGKVLVANYYGPYEQSGMGHEAIDTYLKSHPEIQVIGAPREEYITDPETEPNPANWLTRVVYPIK
jgi:effector-binding domain-containing protein